jgi:radical SAM superfamily enzyme YgiQ (UPF0313 family)
MNVLLIWPKFESFSFWNFENVCEITGTRYMTPPLGLLTVAAMLPETWELRLVDENVELTTDQDLEWADVVLMGSKIVSRSRALELITRARGLGNIVVLGGADVTVNATPYAEGGAHILCVGEAERTVPELVALLENGDRPEGLVIAADGMADIGDAPPPRFDLIRHSDYLYLALQYSRGCPYTCEFCNVIDIFDGYRCKQPEQLLAELDVVYATGYRGQLDFFDDNFAGNMKKAKVMLRALSQWQKDHKYPFTFSTSMTLNIAKDEELLRLLREARFKYFLVGIETPSEEALITASKPQNTGFSIAEAVDRIYRIAGATVHSGFLLGMDGEPDDIKEQVIACIEETSIPWVMSSIIYPLPGTGMSKRLEREGRLFPAARVDLPKTANGDIARDQISAGVQFVPQRDPATLVSDLLEIMEYSYNPANYFARCADVACRLDTVPNLIPGWRIFARNMRTFVRLCWRATKNPSMRGPFWKAFTKVLFNNSKGIEALATLAVLYTHFQGMIPYCREVLEAQRAAMLEAGSEQWLAAQMAEDVGSPSPFVQTAKQVAKTA